MRLFTDLPLGEIARLEALEGAEINDAKKVLADAATTMAHGAVAAHEAAETARRTFEDGAAGGNLPTVAFEDGLTVSRALIALGFAASNGEVKRKLVEGAIRVNGDVVREPTHAVAAGDKVSFGAKKHGLISQA
jgi:tyrosyl-tRNA synthetase